MEENVPPTKMAKCECAEAGWCDRHQCHKSRHFVSLCRSRPDYFQMWEEGIGPGQKQALKPSEPAFGRKVVNFAGAAIEHVRTGRKNVSRETYEHRISACRLCDLCDQTRMVCRHPQCGCRLEKKAMWESAKCPLGLWNNNLGDEGVRVSDTS